MKLDSIGRNIRDFRCQRNMRQEDLAEKAGLSVNYIGQIERGDKVPALETFIEIINALGVSADMILRDIVETEGDNIADPALISRVMQLSQSDRKLAYDILDAIIRNSAK